MNISRTLLRSNSQNVFVVFIMLYGIVVVQHLLLINEAKEVARSALKEDIFSISTPTPTNKQTITISPTSTPSSTSSTPAPRYAVSLFIDNPSHLYGLYSIKNQLEKFNVTTQQDVSLVAIVPDTFAKKHPAELALLKEWCDDVPSVDKNYIHTRLRDEGLWKGTFNKLWVFNLTDYNKVILLDTDILIRTSILHWFHYMSPAATQPVDAITWNSGAMVITPNAILFDQMMNILPQVGVNRGDFSHDNWNTWISDQGFLSAFFTHQEHIKNPAWRMKTMPSESSILISSLRAPNYLYWYKNRRHIIETVHMTTAKPWKKGTVTNNDVICDMLREWKESVKDLSKITALKPIQYDFLRNCPSIVLASKGKS